MEFYIKSANAISHNQNIPRRDNIHPRLKPVRTFRSLNISLFTNIDDKPLRFYLNWDEAYSREPIEEIEEIRETIEVYGGQVSRTFLEMKEDDFCITLLVKRGVESTGVVKTFSLHNQRDLFDSSFVFDSVQNQKLMNLNNYRLKDYCCNEYDANQVLLQNLKWAEVFDEVELVGHNDACSGVIQFDAFYYDVKRLGHDWFDLDISRIGTFSETDKQRDATVFSDETMKLDLRTFDNKSESDIIGFPIRNAPKRFSMTEPDAIEANKSYVRPMYKYIRTYIMKAVYEVGAQSGLKTLGNRQSLWKEVCRHIVLQNEEFKSAEVKHGINFRELESKWVGIQKHFYSFLLKNYEKYYKSGSEEFNFFRRWNKQ